LSENNQNIEIKIGLEKSLGTLDCYLIFLIGNHYS